jgi:hypothetical protein
LSRATEALGVDTEGQRIAPPSMRTGIAAHWREDKAACEQRDEQRKESCFSVLISRSKIESDELLPPC